MEEEGVREIKKIRKSHLSRWFKGLAETADGEGARAAASVRLLFAYAVQRHLIAAGRNPLEGLAPFRLEEERLLTADERQRLDRLDMIPDDSFENIRDRVFLRVIEVSGVWLGGLVALDIYDPSNLQSHTILPEGVIRYRAGSGQTAVAVVDAKTMEWFDRWVAVRGDFFEGLVGSGPLWMSRRGERVRRASMAPRIRKLAAKCGLEEAPKRSASKTSGAKSRSEE